MRRRTLGLAVLLVLATLSFAGRPRACEPWIPEKHTLDPAQIGVDVMPPELAQPTVSELHKNEDTSAFECTPKCGAGRSARLINLATDDMTPVEKIGYRVAPAGGNVAHVSNGYNNDTAVLAYSVGLTVFWDSDDDFDFTVQVIAVDSAGNESAPRTVRISSGSGGCSVGHRRAGDGFTLFVVALALAIAAARRRRPRA